MKVFLIIVAVLAVIIIAILSLSATVTLVYDKGWHTKIQILFIEKDIVLSKILSFVLFPEKKAEEVAKESKNKKNNKNNSNRGNRGIKRIARKTKRTKKRNLLSKKFPMLP